MPAPVFESTEEHTRTVLFAHKYLSEMDKEERIRAYYMHAGLRYIQRSAMTNTSLREHFSIEPQNSAMASRIIKETLDAGKIFPLDENASRKYTKFVPWWAK